MARVYCITVCFIRLCRPGSRQSGGRVIRVATTSLPCAELAPVVVRAEWVACGAEHNDYVYAMLNFCASVARAWCMTRRLRAQPPVSLVLDLVRAALQPTARWSKRLLANATCMTDVADRESTGVACGRAQVGAEARRSSLPRAKLADTTSCCVQSPTCSVPPPHAGGCALPLIWPGQRLVHL